MPATRIPSGGIPVAVEPPAGQDVALIVVLLVLMLAFLAKHLLALRGERGFAVSSVGHFSLCAALRSRAA